MREQRKRERRGEAKQRLRPGHQGSLPQVAPGNHSLRPPGRVSSLGIFSPPVGERKNKNCSKLSLSLRGTLARPSARFWMAAFSCALEGYLSNGSPLWGSCGSPRGGGLRGPGRCSECAEGAGRSGVQDAPAFAAGNAGSLMVPWRYGIRGGPPGLAVAGRPCGFEPARPAFPESPRCSPAAAGSLSLARTQSSRPAGKASPPASHPRRPRTRCHCFAWGFSVPATQHFRAACQPARNGVPQTI